MIIDTTNKVLLNNYTFIFVLKSSGLVTKILWFKEGFNSYKVGISSEMININ